MKQLRGLTIDNGGSEVRTLPLGESVSKGMTTLSNDFVSINPKNFRIKEAEDKLGLCNIMEAPQQEYVGIIARGSTGKLYEGEMLAIDSQSPKTGNPNYYKQFIYAVARDAMQAVLNGEVQVLEDYKKSSFLFNRTLQSEGGVDYILVTCIPIKEHSGKSDCASILKEKLAGNYVVNFPLIDGNENTVMFTIKPEFLGVVPEGGVAMTALRDSIEDDDVTLVIDVGHITTDIALFKGKTLYGNRVISSPFAGSTLIANVRAAMTDEGYALNESQVAKVIETGRVKNGAGTVDVLKIIAEQKKLFVQNYLKPEIVQLLNMNACNARQVQNVVPIGAPMNFSDKTASITNELVKECNLTAASIKYLASDLRYVNLAQASIFTNLLYRQALKKAV